jgi:hypothetical protein
VTQQIIQSSAPSRLRGDVACPTAGLQHCMCGGGGIKVCREPLGCMRVAHGCARNNCLRKLENQCAAPSELCRLPHLATCGLLSSRIFLVVKACTQDMRPKYTFNRFYTRCSLATKKVSMDAATKGTRAPPLEQQTRDLEFCTAGALPSFSLSSLISRSRTSQARTGEGRRSIAEPAPHALLNQRHSLSIIPAPEALHMYRVNKSHSAGSMLG